MPAYTYRIVFNDDLSGTLEYGSYVPDVLVTENTAPDVSEEADGSVIEGDIVTTTLPEYPYEPGTFVPSCHLWFPPYRFANSYGYLEAFENQDAATAYLEDHLGILLNETCPYLDPTTLEPTVPAIPRVIQENSEVSRKKRDLLLFESDWTQTTDSVLSDQDQAVWRSYRQELRDITELAGWPFLKEADWPTKP